MNYFYQLVSRIIVIISQFLIAPPSLFLFFLDDGFPFVFLEVGLVLFLLGRLNFCGPAFGAGRCTFFEILDLDVVGEALSFFEKAFKLAAMV